MGIVLAAVLGVVSRVNVGNTAPLQKFFRFLRRFLGGWVWEGLGTGARLPAKWGADGLEC